MVYPNAGLPNELGEYDEMPDTTAGLVREWAEHGQVNILGGCCGSTPAHIAAMAKAVEGLAPRHIPEVTVRTRLAGRSEEHTSELQSLMRISYAVFCLKNKTYASQHR